MQQLLLFVLLFIANVSLGQSIALDVKKMNPSEPYTNISTTVLHNDENTSVFLIFIKQALRKHVHQYHTEVITVLGGKGRMYMGGDYFNVSKGDYIIVPANTAHAILTIGKKPLKILSIQSPEYLENDYIPLEEEPIEESSAKTKKKNKKENEIPEFEGEND